MRKVIFFLFPLLFFCIAKISYAQGDLDLCPKNTEDFNFNILCNLQPGNTLPGLLTFIIIVAVVIALVFLIWGGIKWITSGGDKGNVETARNHIIAAIVGLIVVFLAWFIINFILQTFFGSGLNQGISLPQIIGPEEQPPTPTVTPPATSPTLPTPTPVQDVEGATDIPPCPTAYPPDYICTMEPQ